MWTRDKFRHRRRNVGERGGIMIYRVELTDTEYNLLTGFMNMISSEIKPEYFQKADLEPVRVMRIEDTTEYKMGYEAGKQNGYACCRNNTELVKELKEAEYNKGLEAANHAMGVVNAMTGIKFTEWFNGCVSVDEVICKFTMQQIVEITKAYEENQKADTEIKVGDIIHSKAAKQDAVITHDGGHIWICIGADGVGFPILKARLNKDWEKIGHTDDLLVLFAKLRSEKNEENN